MGADHGPATVARNLLRSLGSAAGRREAVHKARARVERARTHGEPAAAKAWCREVASDADEVVGALAPDLWHEACLRAWDARVVAADALGRVEDTVGGGGDDRLLWFLCRLLRPRVVVETGVAAGFTSRAILDALHAEGEGHLWSSDLPNLHLDRPHERIGTLVPAARRNRWTLLLDGDRANLPRIVAEVPGPIDLFAYDSDKSTAGRTFALDLVWPHLADDAVIVVDDVENGWHLRDWTAAHPDLSWWVFRYDGTFSALVVRGAPLAARVAPGGP